MSTLKDVEVFGSFSATSVLTIEGTLIGGVFSGTYSIVGGNETGPISGTSATVGTTTTVTLATPSSVQNSITGTVTIDDTTGVATGTVAHVDQTPTTTNVTLNGTCTATTTTAVTAANTTDTPTCLELLDNVWRAIYDLSVKGRQIVRVRYEDEEVWFKNEDYDALLSYYNRIYEMCPEAATSTSLPNLQTRRGRPGRGYVVC